jgi:hypothetical protein
LIAAVLLLAMRVVSVAQGISKPEAPGTVVNLSEHQAANAEAVARLASTSQRGRALARAIAATAHVGPVDAGVETAKQALLDCQKEALGGSGPGPFAMLGRPESRTDHCFR